MQTIKRYITTLLMALLIVPGALAQNPAAGQSGAKDVQIIIQPQQVRFLANSAIAEMHLQVFDPAGALVYDSGAAGATEINWLLQNASGEMLKSGLYAYTLSLKEAGAAESRVQRGHFILDRAKDRDGKTDKLWVTSQNDNGVGTELTVARDESGTITGIAGASTSIDRKSAPERKTDSVGGTADDKQQAKAVIAAANGTTGHLAKFTTGTDLGNSVITEQNGNIGVGTAIPAYKLDVAGALRAFRDTSNDVVVQTTGGTNAWARLRMLTPSQQWSLGTSEKYNGNQFYLVDDTYKQARMTIQPNAGEVAFPSPSSNHIVVRTAGGTNAWAQYRVQTTNQTWAWGTSQAYNGDQFYLFDATRNQSRLTIQPNGGAIALPLGNVGIGTTNPQTKLHVESPGFAEVMIKSPNERAILSLSNGLGPSNYVWTLESGVGGQFPSLFGIYNRVVNKPGLTIDGNLLVSVKALQITGGADFAENFDINVAPTASSEATKVEAGMVVSIDPENPGKLMLSTQAYDPQVAGIVSGAGGVKAGMVMGQEGTLANGQHPVALTGRVYCWADASQGEIKPGNLLTTSATPGHAMKVTDPAKAQGAIIGKAMTGLKEGKGLVLVLVTLQ